MNISQLNKLFKSDYIFYADYMSYAEYMFQRLKETAKVYPEFLDMYKVVKKRRQSMPKKFMKHTVRKIFKLTSITDNSFTIG